jgi:EipB-like
MRLPVMIAALALAGAAILHPAQAANAPAPAAGPTVVPMLAHRALYTLTMGPTKGQDVVAARGTMAYEVTDACDAWIVRQRLRMTVTNSDGEDVEMTSDYATWEAKDGLRLRFHMRQTTDTAVTSQTDGEARLDRLGGPGEAHYTSPKDQTLKLPIGTVFPMIHTETILAASRQKQHFLNLPLFDGTDENGVEDSFIIVLDQKPPMANPSPVLASLPSTKVHLSFFDHDVASMMPTYEVTMRYWENGVADDMAMDFGDFVMNAKIKEFAPQPRKC